MSNRKNNREIFREKSLERVSSPDELDKYIKTTRPSIWLILSAVVLILVGIIVWGTVCKIESSATVGCIVDIYGGESYIKESDKDKLCDDSYIEINGKRYEIDSVEGPYITSEDSVSFLSSAAEIENGSWYYVLYFDCDNDYGEYKGKVVFEKISPITFIIN